MAKSNWNDLTTQQKAVIAGGAAVDAGMRLWAASDLRSRGKDEVKGPKWLWALGLSTVSSFGVLPALYLLVARRKSSDSADAAPA